MPDLPVSARVGVTDTFDADQLDPRWKPWMVGTGSVTHTDRVLRCALDPSSGSQYSDAQITDYQGLPRRAFPWSPPLRLTVRAWASHDADVLKGTAGFGFWNEPFVPGAHDRPHLPQAVWFFFASPPSNMALAQGVPGWGWKAAVFDATRWPFLALMPLAPIGFLMMRIPPLYRRLWPVGQRSLHVSEAALSVSLTRPHTYELEWLTDRVIFRVEGEEVRVAPYSPRGPLGFIAWIDNQYAIVTPQGHFKFGVVATAERQWIALDRVEIQPL